MNIPIKANGCVARNGTFHSTERVDMRRPHSVIRLRLQCCYCLMTTGRDQDISRKEGFILNVILMHSLFSGGVFHSFCHFF